MLLAAYIIGWMGGVFGGPALAIVAGDAHDVTLLSEGGRTHVVLHHSASEAPESGSAGTWDSLCGHPMGTAQCSDHSDHEFHFPGQGTPTLIKSEPLPFRVFTTILSAAPSAPIFSSPVIQPEPSASPPDPLLRVLRTIVLLI